MNVKLKQKMKKIFGLYLTNNFVIRDPSAFIPLEPKIPCGFIPVTLENFHRVADFREGSRIPQYAEKLSREEIGFFAEHAGKMIGSIWATLNMTERAVVARRYMRLMPKEALIHDIVTAPSMRGKNVGPFMVSKIGPALFDEFRARAVLIDVKFNNRASMRMFDKLGLRNYRRVLSVCIFGKLVFQKPF